MPAWGFAAGALISGVGQIIGGNKAANAAKKQAQAQNAATDAQHKYDVELWNMKKDRLIANRDHKVEEVELQAKNEGKIAAWKDAQNKDKYNWDMMIRNREQVSLNEQYRRSEQIYNSQIGLNALTAEAAVNDEYRSLDEIQVEGKFDAQEAYVNSLIAEGKARAMGTSGRTSQKLGITTYAEYGRGLAMIEESLDAAERNTRAVLQEIARDKASADLAAYAQKMLDPGELPLPMVPWETPMSTFQYPRELEDYDFGPQPVRGAYADPGAAADRVWGATISSVAGTIGGAFTGWASKQ